MQLPRQITSTQFTASLLLLLLILSPTPSECSIRLCGKRLTTTLLAVCRNQLCGGLSAFKRSPQIADLFHLHHQQKRGGIATECCEKRCSFSYLKTYCCDQTDDDLLE